MQIRPFHLSDTEAVIELWQACDLIRPWNDPWKDIRRKVDAQPELFLVGEVDGKIVAALMVGYDGHRGWLNYLGVSPKHRRNGCGREIVEAAETLLRARGCAKINLQVRSTNLEVIEFYRRLGYVQDEVVSFGKRLEHDG